MSVIVQYYGWFWLVITAAWGAIKLLDFITGRTISILGCHKAKEKAVIK